MTLRFSGPCDQACVLALRYLEERCLQHQKFQDEDDQPDDEDAPGALLIQWLSQGINYYEWPLIGTMQSNAVNLYSFTRAMCVHGRMDRVFSFLRKYNFIYPSQPARSIICRPPNQICYFAKVPENFVTIQQLFFAILSAYCDQTKQNIDSKSELGFNSPALSQHEDGSLVDDAEDGSRSRHRTAQRLCTLLRVMDVPLNKFTGHDRLYELYVWLCGRELTDFAKEILKRLLDDRKSPPGNFSVLNKYIHKSRTQALAKAYDAVFDFCVILPKLIVEMTYPTASFAPEPSSPKNSCRSVDVSTVPTQISTTSSFMIPNLPFDDQLQAEFVFGRLEAAIQAIGSSTGRCSEIFLWYLYRFSRRFRICGVELEQLISALIVTTLAESSDVSGVGSDSQAVDDARLGASAFGNLLLYQYLLAMSSVSISATSTVRDSLLHLVDAQPDNARYVVRFVELKLREIGLSSDSVDDDARLAAYGDSVARLVTALGYSHNFDLVFVWRCLAKTIWFIYVDGFDPGSLLIKTAQKWWIKLHMHKNLICRAEEKLVAYKSVVAAFLM